MSDFLTFTALGLVLGAVYGIAASGLVLTYNTSGVFNFAHGAEAMLGTFAYWQLRYGWHWPTWAAVLVALGVVAPLLGGALYLLVIKGLRNTAEVTKIVVTVAILLGTVALAQWIWNPLTARTDDPFFGDAGTVTLLGATLTTHDLITVGCAVLIGVGLWFLFYRTRVGVAMRAVVDDVDLLRLNGHSPDRLSALSWVLGGMLAVLAGILVTPISGGSLDANSLTLLVIDAFAAALFGRLRSVPRTFAGAVVLGLAANYVLGYFPSAWSWTSDFRISLPMIILFVVLVLVPQDRVQGAAVRTRERYRVPSVRTAARSGAALVVVVVLLRLLMVDSDVTVLTLGMTCAVTALSLTLLTGYAGQLNLAVCSFGALATLVVYHLGLTGHGLDARMTLWGVLLAVLVTALIGAAVALPALRLRGLHLALATMAFGVFVTDMVLADISPHVLPLLHLPFSIFTEGSLNVPPLRIGPLDLADRTTFLVTVTVLFAAIGTGLVALRNSGYGRRLTAMRDSPAASAMLGQNLLRLKLGVFALSAAIAGLGGILMSSAVGTVTSDNFSIFVSLSLLMLTVSAGIGYVSGALIGGLTSGVGFVIIISSFNNLADGSSALNGLYGLLAHLAAVAPALIGLTIGRSPSGFLHELFEGYRRLRNARPVLVGGAAFELLIYLLSLTGVLGHWWFGVLTYVLAVMLPTFGQLLMPDAMRAPGAPVPERPLPLDLVGIDEPYSDRVRQSLDRQLGLSTGLPTGLPTTAPVPAQQGV